MNRSLHGAQSGEMKANTIRRVQHEREFGAIEGDKRGTRRSNNKVSTPSQGNTRKRVFFKR